MRSVADYTYGYAHALADHVVRPVLFLAYSVLTENQKKRFEMEDELDFSFGIQNLARFRGNCFKQRGCVSMVIRQIPFNIRSFTDLGLPAVIATLAPRWRQRLSSPSTLPVIGSTSPRARSRRVSSTRAAITLGSSANSSQAFVPVVTVRCAVTTTRIKAEPFPDLADEVAEAAVDRRQQAKRDEDPRLGVRVALRLDAAALLGAPYHSGDEVVDLADLLA